MLGQVKTYRDYQLSGVASGPKRTRYDRINEARRSDRDANRQTLLDSGCKPLSAFPDYLVSSAGEVYSTLWNRVRRLNPGIKPGGYEFIGLHGGEKTRYLMVHRLVAVAFIPNPYCLPEVNHIDGNKRNNRMENLEWVATSENARHNYKLGIVHRGSKNHNCKLTPDQVRTIRAATGRYLDIGKRFGVSAQTVCNVKRSSKYGDVS